MQPAWSAPVRFIELDREGIVHNARYLAYCDEAMIAFSRPRGLEVGICRLVTSTITWSAPLRYGDVVDVYVRCERVGTSSFTLTFEIVAGDRACCRVETTYVHVDRSGRPAPVPDAIREALLAD